MSVLAIPTTDWVAIFSTDTGETVFQNKPSPNTGFAVAVDQVSGDVFWADGNRDSNTGGHIWRLSPPYTGTWVDLILQGVAGGITDGFGRTHAPGGWGTSDDGQTWVGTSSGLLIPVAGEGQIQLGAAGSISAAIAAAFDEVECLFQTRASVRAVGGAHAAELDVRRTSNTFYSVRMRQLTNGNWAIALLKTVAGVLTVLHSGLEVTLASDVANGVVWNVRFDCVDLSPTTLRARAWFDGDEEPSTWAIETTDAEASLQTTGDIRARGQAFTSYTAAAIIGFRNLQVTNLNPVSGTAGKRPLGLVAFRDASNHQVLVAAVEDHGLVRWISTTGVWTDVDTSLFMQGPASTKSAPMDCAPGSPNSYLMDRDTGQGRSTDYGLTWEQWWDKTSPVDMTGFLAVEDDGSTVHVSLSDEYWVVSDADTIDLMTAPPPPVIPLPRGTASWLNHNVNTKAAFVAHGTTIVSAWSDWSTVEAVHGVIDFGLLAAADNGFCDAHDKGYRILWRIAMGIDAPIGRPGTSQSDWLFSSLGVARVRTFDNDPPGAWREVFIPLWWDTDYQAAQHDLIVAVGAFLDGDCPRDPSHKRSAHLYGVMAAGPTENGTEMTYSYSRSGTTPFSAGGTLGSPITSGSLSIVVPGATATAQPNKGLMKIGSEEIFYSARVGNTFTVPSGAGNGRGFNLTTAASHSAGDAVSFADQTKTIGTSSALATYNGISGVWDRFTLNKAAWAAVDGFTTDDDRRDAARDAWIACIDDMAATLPSDVPIMVAIGAIFADGNVRADDIVTTEAAAYGERLLVGVTDIRLADSGYSTFSGDTLGHYGDAGARPDNADTLDLAVAGGSRVWGQTSGLTAVANGQRFVDAIESFIHDYPDVLFIETNASSRFTATRYTTWAAYGWPGRANGLTKDYFVDDPASVKKRLEVLV